jgi:hypothetical protein
LFIYNDPGQLQLFNVTDNGFGDFNFPIFDITSSNFYEVVDFSTSSFEYYGAGGIANNPVFRIDATGNLLAASSVTASSFFGDGSHLTNITIPVQPCIFGTGGQSVICGLNSNVTPGIFSFDAGGDGNSASGSNSFVTGHTNTAAGGNAFAAGEQASANETNTFVFADGSAAPYNSHGTHTFNVLANGGVFFDSTSVFISSVPHHAGPNPPSGDLTIGGFLAVGGPTNLASHTIAELQGIVPSVGDIYRCSDCVIPESIAIATGTSAGNFGIIQPGAFQ